ncbi:cytochrome P450 [Methylogaea oryzae]|uniref:cytochrome P450 n=1 Tax=Methylogaea oryzae TaxID=1295382 RepID=UPI0020D0A214|nr:cytochrome P450 [Methylogaea oryzae]
MLAQLAQRKEQDPEKSFTDEQICDHLFTILMAGHESTASGLAWGIYWMYRHPEIRQKLLAELDEKASPGDLDALSGLPYLDAFCKETLRIHPMIPDVARRLAVPFTLRGRRVEAGDILVASINLAHHRPDLYPEPDRFRPERFLERSFNQYEYFPFGGGERYCLGRGLGLLELKIGLATIIRRYELEVDISRPVRPTWNDAVRSPKGGVKMKVVGLRNP